jgi:choline-glycine betaine transporter
MRRSNFNQIFWGLVIIVVGVLFLAQNLGYLQDYSFWKYLPALLIILGLYQLFINHFRAWV